MKQKDSRLSRSTHEKTKKQTIFFAIAIIILLFLLLQFGPIILNSVGGFTSKFSSNKEEQVLQDKNSLEAPFINSIPEATDDKDIVISGSSSYSDAQVELFVNGDRFDNVTLTSNQKFKFENVTLSEGDNIIKVRVRKGDIASPFSRDYTVVYSKGEPKLDVSNPSDGAQLSKGDQEISIQGKTDPSNTVSVNGFRAVVDSDGNFSYYLKLQDGDNEIKVIATSESGKTTEKTIKVNFKP